jgi:hypothetical protein
MGFETNQFENNRLSRDWRKLDQWGGWEIGVVNFFWHKFAICAEMELSPLTFMPKW